MPEIPVLFCQPCACMMLPAPQAEAITLHPPTSTGAEPQEETYISDIFRCPQCGHTAALSSKKIAFDMFEAVGRSLQARWEKLASPPANGEA